MARISIDPVTRIEGHLRIEAELQGGTVTKAWSSAQMWRGIETILRGRPPEDAWVYTQRFCGVCTTVHAIASIRSVEHALKVAVPLNAQYIRNIIMAQHSVQDHIVHFYQLSALDWVDVVSAIEADPKKTAQLAQSLSDWPGNSETEFKMVQQKLHDLVQTGRLGIFSSGYWGHPAMQLPPEANLMAVAHYLTALDYQRKAAQAVAILGGKNPHIQNLCVGGVTTAINMENLAALNMERIAALRTLMEETREFVHKVYYPDMLAIATAYKEWFRYGRGVANFLAVPELPENADNTTFAMPGGIVANGDITRARLITNPQDAGLINGINENVAHAWYEGSASRHPWEGETRPHYTDFQEDGKYSWGKAPRLDGQPMQVGPLAQLFAAYAGGNQKVRKLVDASCAKLGVSVGDLHSTMGRLAARAIRTHLMADYSLEYLDKLMENLVRGDKAYVNPTEIPEGEYRGVGFHEAPRGTLSHWIVIKDRKIRNYQVVVPSTWNASPRDEKGAPGPYEASLVGLPVAQADQPLELLRTIHSFDPCISCAVHTLDPAGKELARVKVV